MISEQTLGGRIVQLRNERNMSQQDLAKALDISTAALRNLEHNTAEPRLYTLQQLANEFTVPIDYLVYGIMPTVDSYGGVDTASLYKQTGLNDSAFTFLRDAIDTANHCGGDNGYIATLNALIAGGLLPLVWQLSALNDELRALDKEIAGVKASQPKTKDIVDEMKADNALEPLLEKRDFLKYRFFRCMEKTFDALIEKGAE